MISGNISQHVSPSVEKRNASGRDHLFISYAYEDSALADWLARKLAAEGYLVWYDRFILLGGESYPKDIDDAIKNRTFRFLALLSRNSVTKANPLKERTLALNLARERNEDFLIPLNVDGLKSTELDWMTSDLNFIPFHENWGTGFGQLVKKLTTLQTPRPLKNGRQIAAETFLQEQMVRQSPEILFSNHLPFQQIPQVVLRFKFSQPVYPETRRLAAKLWAFYLINPNIALAFQPPRELPEGYGVVSAGGALWSHHNQLDGVETSHLLISLLQRAVIVHCISKGLRAIGHGEVYFPPNVVPANKIHFTNWNGKSSWVQVAGERTAWQAGRGALKYRYHLAPRFKIVRRNLEMFALQIRLGLHITDGEGNPMPDRSAAARRKGICRSWWNDAWLSRVFAVAHFLANGGKTIQLGHAGKEQIVIGTNPLQYQAPLSLNEEAIGKAEPEQKSDTEIDEIEAEDADTITLA
jgi:hypothetical protein